MTKQNAIEWREEADKFRDARSPHTTVLREKLERATYKERLEMGGELGIRRTQEAAKAADDKNTVLAKHDMSMWLSHRKPRRSLMRRQWLRFVIFKRQVM